MMNAVNNHKYSDLIADKIKSYIESLTAYMYDDNQDKIKEHQAWVDQSIESITEEYTASESIFRSLLADLKDDKLTIGDLASVDTLYRCVEEVAGYGEVRSIIGKETTIINDRLYNAFWNILGIYSSSIEKYNRIRRTIRQLRDRLLDLCGSHTYYRISTNDLSGYVVFNKQKAHLDAIRARASGHLGVNIKEYTLVINKSMVTRLINLIMYDAMNGHITLDVLDSLERFWLDDDNGLRLLTQYIKASYMNVFSNEEASDIYLMYMMTRDKKDMRISKWIKRHHYQGPKSESVE